MAYVVCHCRRLRRVVCGRHVDTCGPAARVSRDTASRGVVRMAYVASTRAAARTSDALRAHQSNPRQHSARGLVSVHDLSRYASRAPSGCDADGAGPRSGEQLRIARAMERSERGAAKTMAPTQELHGSTDSGAAAQRRFDTGRHIRRMAPWRSTLYADVACAPTGYRRDGSTALARWPNCPLSFQR
jgi:hypothetical protein